MFAVIEEQNESKRSIYNKLQSVFKKESGFYFRIIKTGSARVLHLVYKICEQDGNKRTARNISEAVSALRTEGIHKIVPCGSVTQLSLFAEAGITQPDTKKQFTVRIKEAAEFALHQSGFDPRNTCAIVCCDKADSRAADMMKYISGYIRYPVLICREKNGISESLNEIYGTASLNTCGGLDEFSKIVIRFHNAPLPNIGGRAILLNAGEKMECRGALTVDGALFEPPEHILRLFPQNTNKSGLSAALDEYMIVPHRDMPIAALTCEGIKVL